MPLTCSYYNSERPTRNYVTSGGQAAQSVRRVPIGPRKHMHIYYTLIEQHSSCINNALRERMVVGVSASRAEQLGSTPSRATSPTRQHARTVAQSTANRRAVRHTYARNVSLHYNMAQL